MDDDPDDWTDLVKREDCVREVTLDEHFAEWREAIARGTADQSAMDATKANYESHAQPGDQWWEWVQGNVALMQMGSIALVRGGVVVWARNTWIS